MKKEIKINKLAGWTSLIENILKGIATFNDNNDYFDITAIEKYVKQYNCLVPKGIFNYTTLRIKNTLVIFSDDELMLSITMCEINELLNNENY